MTVRGLRVACVCVGILLAVVTGLLLRDLRATPARETAESQDRARQGAEAARTRIEARLAALAEAGTELASGAGALVNDHGALRDRLHAVLERDEQWRQSGFAFDPDKSGIGLFGPYVDRHGGGPVDGLLDYDYTVPDAESTRRTAWYHRAMDEGPGWSEPYTGSLDVAYAEFTTPFPDAVDPVGVAWLNFDLHGLRRIVGSAVSAGSYGIVFTDSGTVVSHPTEAFLGKNIDELAPNEAWIVRQLVGPAVEKRESGVRSFVNDTNGLVHWVVWERLSNGWWLAVGFDEEDHLGAGLEEMRERTAVRLAALGALLFLGLGVVLRGDLDSIKLWRAAALTTVVGVAAVAAIWHLSYTLPQEPPFRHDVVLDSIGLEMALMPLDGLVPEDDPVRIPTGLYIQQIEYLSAYDVGVSGILWQRIPPGHTREQHGIVFPEAVDVRLQPSFTEPNGAGTTIGWHFTTTLRQPFRYNRYPFDREYVWIRLWHKDIFGNYALTPDFNAYPVLRPETMPGVEQDMVLEGWVPTGAFFGYRQNEYSTNFGGVTNLTDGGRPEMYFNIGMKRDFLAFFVGDMITLIIVSLLLFAVLMISTGRGGLAERYGFSSSTVLAYCASLFFVLIVSHVHLRQKLAAEGVIYLEGFYFVLYGAILLVSMAAILFVSDVKWRWLHWSDGLVFKLGYWPLITLALLFFTWWEFF